MEAEISELEALSDCRDRLGRKIKSRAERERLLLWYERSGLTQVEYCRREGINIHTFTSWRQNARKRSESTEGLGMFGEVEVSKPKAVSEACCQTLKLYFFRKP